MILKNFGEIIRKFNIAAVEIWPWQCILFAGIIQIVVQNLISVIGIVDNNTVVIVDAIQKAVFFIIKLQSWIDIIVCNGYACTGQNDYQNQRNH